MFISTEYQWILAPKTLTVESIFNNYLQKKSLVFLAGSGISIDPPSNLPTGYQFTKIILQALIPTEYQELVLSLMNPDRPDKRDPGDFIRFEQLMEKLVEHNIDPNFSLLEGIGFCNRPNVNHLILAELLKIKQGHQIFTTNFDSLIEHALVTLQVEKQYIRPVIYKEEWDNNQSNNKHLSLYKLHGSFINVATTKDTRNSLQATLEQIAKGKENVFSLEEWKRENLQHYLQEQAVIVIGYSGLDDFDIIPALSTIKSDQYLIWINHQRNISINNAIIEIIGEGSSIRSSNPRVSAQLIQLAKNDARQPKKLILITVDTTDMLEYILKYFSITKKTLSLNIEQKTSIFTIPDHFKNISEDLKWNLTGRLLEERSKISEAYQCYMHALIINDQLGNLRDKAANLNNVGLLLANQNRWDEALDYYKQALTVNKEITNLQGEAATLNNIGLAFNSQNRWDEALDSYQQALVIDEQLGDLKGKATDLNNIGFLFANQGQVDKAINSYQQALVITEQLGDLKGKATNLNNIGSLFYGQGQVDSALDYFQQALAIAEQIGDLSEKITNLNNIGLISASQGQVDEALDSYQQVLETSEKLNDLKGKATCLNNIGFLFANQGQVDKALDYCQQALTISEQLGDLKGKATCLNNISLIFVNQGRVDQALDYYQQALTISEQLGDLSGKATNLNNIGLIFINQGRIDEALEYYKQSLAVTEQSGDSKGKAINLTNIGQLIYNQGHVDEALNYLKQGLIIFEQLSNSKEKAINLTDIGLILANQGQIDEALNY